MVEIQLERISCITCGILFWISSEYNQELIRNKRSFYCPNGHVQHYVGETTEAKLQQAQKTIQDKNTEIAQLREELRKKRRSKHEVKPCPYCDLIEKLKRSV